MQIGKAMLQVRACAKRDAGFYSKLETIARKYAIPAKSLETFMIGEGSLTTQELLRLCDDFDTWVWVVHSQNIAANTSIH